MPLTRRVRLPSKVALFQVCLPHRSVVMVSSLLDGPRARLAQGAAAILASRGQAVIVITVAELEASLDSVRRDVAAASGHE